MDPFLFGIPPFVKTGKISTIGLLSHRLFSSILSLLSHVPILFICSPVHAKAITVEQDEKVSLIFCVNWISSCLPVNNEWLRPRFSLSFSDVCTKLELIQISGRLKDCLFACPSFPWTHTLVSFLQVHSNNRHTQGVRVFSKVECLFKPGILQPWSSPLTLPVPLEDLKDPSSRPISIPLGGRAAQILCCKFYFADRWLLISEISFLSGKKQNWCNSYI